MRRPWTKRPAAEQFDLDGTAPGPMVSRRLHDPGSERGPLRPASCGSLHRPVLSPSWGGGVAIEGFPRGPERRVTSDAHLPAEWRPATDAGFRAVLPRRGGHAPASKAAAASVLVVLATVLRPRIVAVAGSLRQGYPRLSRVPPRFAGVKASAESPVELPPRCEVAGERRSLLAVDSCRNAHLGGPLPQLWPTGTRPERRRPVLCV